MTVRTKKGSRTFWWSHSGLEFPSELSPVVGKEVGGAPWECTDNKYTIITPETFLFKPPNKLISTTIPYLIEELPPLCLDSWQSADRENAVHLKQLISSKHGPDVSFDTTEGFAHSDK